MHEIEDTVAARVHPGSHARPRYRALRRYRGSEPLEIALAAQLAEIRQRTPVRLQKLRVHAVDTEHDHPLAGRLGGLMRAPGGNRSDGDDGAHALHAAASR